MKKLLLAICFLGIVSSCNQKPKERSLGVSVGNINEVKVVVDKQLWQGAIGDALRDVLAAPVDGLPREEPLFSIDQIQTDAFTSFLSTSRIFVRVKFGEPSGFLIEKDLYARPQTAITISGEDEEAVLKQIQTNSQKMVSELKAQELDANQRRIRKSLKNVDSLKTAFGVSLRFPTAYRYASREKDFFWMRKDIKRGGNMNITVYQVPLYTIDRDTFTLARIVRMRDSIGGPNIPVDGGRFQTERAFSPYLFETEIDGHFAWEMKGTWDVEGRYMAGPFLNYAIRDEKNDRYLILEGFIFSPSLEQRNNMFELEAILRSAKLE